MLEKKFQIKNKYSGGFHPKFETPVDFLQKYTNFFFFFDLKELYFKEKW